ncbi:MAG: phage integrase N-terminal SAM-like domain-containing protein, partial [Saprospirales bacterium]|nr:phage integrase N-terminal SAM-like domain-containing protein [Saprospirales bacterium]
MAEPYVVNAPSNYFPTYFNTIAAEPQPVIDIALHPRKAVKAYKGCFRQFIRYYNEIKPSQLTRKQIDEYIFRLIKEKGISESQQNQILSAIKMFYCEVVGQEEKVIDIIRPKRAQKLPHVLTEREVERLLQADGQFQAPLYFNAGIFGRIASGRGVEVAHPGLASGETPNIHQRREREKDRCTILSEKAFQKLEVYFALYKPVEWVFEGANGGPYSERSVQNIFTKAKIKSGINPYATVHTLRHSFAT